MRPPETKSILLALTLFSAPVAICQESGSGSGAAPDDSKLAGLKEQFSKNMRAVITPAGRLYLEKLQELERKYAAEGKYEAAIATRDEHRAVVAFLNNTVSQPAASPSVTVVGDGGDDPTPTATDLEGIEFEAAAANISDGAEFSDTDLVLPEIGATASWDLGVTEPGGYEVVVEYTSSEKFYVQVKESFFRLSSELPSSGGKKTSLSLGTLKITSRSDAVELTRSGEEDEENGALTVHSIRLISSKD